MNIHLSKTLFKPLSEIKMEKDLPKIIKTAKQIASKTGLIPEDTFVKACKESADALVRSKAGGFIGKNGKFTEKGLEQLAKESGISASAIGKKTPLDLIRAFIDQKLAVKSIIEKRFPEIDKLQNLAKAISKK